MDGKSLNITEEKLNQLKEIVPEVFTENKIDWEKLKAALGDDIEFKNERYVLNWAGKSDAFRVLQSPTTATLVPDKDESVNFDTTENIFIEGENLEVLKVLQKAYFGKIKMIYIDPPYNTGNDNFIYPDKFSETKEEYLSRIGDKDETGYLTREGLFRKNSKDNGHYHSNWLSMMYPRLFLARNLLRDDGVIFISIDDNEVHDLRLLMNEVFGEENFLSQLVWKKKYIGGKHAKHFVDFHEYVIVYAKALEAVDAFLMERPDDEKGKFEFEDEFVETRGKHYVRPLKSNLGLRETLIYSIKCPDGSIVKTQWMVAESTFHDLVKDGRILFKQNRNGIYQVYRKFYEFDGDGKVKVPSLIDDVANANGKLEIKELFNVAEGRDIPFENPKPVGLLDYLLKPTICQGEIVLDFFAGSCTTAHAVLAFNKEDGGNHKFICVQLPEKCDEISKAYKTGYKTIAEIGKERIRRVINKIKEEQEGKLDLDGNAKKQDLGFKVFKLQDSNFKIWRTQIETEEQLVDQLQQHLEPLDENAKTENVLYELLLKSGVPLTAKIEQKEDFYLVNDNEIALILEKVDDKIIKTVIDIKPQKMITLDRLFKNNDQLKTNTALQMKDAGIEFKVV